MKRKSNNGITLIALIITIILMLILAGVVISLTIGKDGIIGIALRAREEYKSAEEKEKKDLDELYSSIKVAGDSKVTLTMEELDEYINRKMQQPTGIKTDTYIVNTITRTSPYTNLTSMSGLTIGKDENNKIDEYLSYSNQDGYTVLKSGWYFINLATNTYSSGTGFSSTHLYFYLNGTALTTSSSTGASGLVQTLSNNTFTVFLSQGDKIYFSSTGGSSAAKSRNATAICYPMF